jgi:acyl carrier protein
MSQSTLAEWDSFAHIKLIIGLQEEFGVRFSTDEVADVGNVPGIRAIIEARV